MVDSAEKRSLFLEQLMALELEDGENLWCCPLQLSMQGIRESKTQNL